MAASTSTSGATKTGCGSDRKAPPPNPLRPRQAQLETAERAPARAKRLSYNESRELATLPDQIDSLEAEHRGLNERIASAGFL
jgi:hypothetical protein